MMFLMIYLRNMKKMFSYPETKKKYSVSFLVPAWNEQDTIENSIKDIENIDYEINEIIVINDKSSDKTPEILKRLAKNYPNLRIINNEKNLGKAESLNRGLKFAKSELIAVVDADSYPVADSIKKMVGFFDDEKVGVVTCPVLVRNRDKFIGKLQAIEYQIISFSRKLLDYVDAIYVTPGPLALYRKRALEDVGGFDKRNMTEDIEVTWNLAHNRWRRRMCLSTGVFSTAPEKFRGWFRQRIRWNIGGLQCIYKYRKSLFKEGIFGWFIIPLFILSTFLGLVGLAIFSYLLTRRTISNFLYTKYSIVANTSLIVLEDFYITPSILNYFGVILFIFGLILTLIMLSILKEKVFVRENLLNIPFFMLIYLSFYPIIMLISIGDMIVGKRTWR